MHIHMLRDLWFKAICKSSAGVASVAGVTFSWSSFREALRRLTLDFTTRPPISLHPAHPLPLPAQSSEPPTSSYLRLMPILSSLGSSPDEISQRFWDVCASLPRSFRQLDPLLPSSIDVLGILANDMHPWFSRCGVSVPLPWEKFFYSPPTRDQDQIAVCMAMIFFSFICARAFCMDATLLIDVSKHEISKRRETQSVSIQRPLPVNSIPTQITTSSTTQTSIATTAVDSMPNSRQQQTMTNSIPTMIPGQPPNKIVRIIPQPSINAPFQQIPAMPMQLGTPVHLDRQIGNNPYDLGHQNNVQIPFGPIGISPNSALGNLLNH